jgi:hypothetical protein
MQGIQVGVMLLTASNIKASVISFLRADLMFLAMLSMQAVVARLYLLRPQAVCKSNMCS